MSEKENKGQLGFVISWPKLNKNNITFICEINSNYSKECLEKFLNKVKYNIENAEKFYF